METINHQIKTNECVIIQPKINSFCQNWTSPFKFSMNFKEILENDPNYSLLIDDAPYLSAQINIKSNFKDKDKKMYIIIDQKEYYKSSNEQGIWQFFIPAGKNFPEFNFELTSKIQPASRFGEKFEIEIIFDLDSPFLNLQVLGVFKFQLEYKNDDNFQNLQNLTNNNYSSYQNFCVSLKYQPSCQSQLDQLELNFYLKYNESIMISNYQNIKVFIEGQEKTNAEKNYVSNKQQDQTHLNIKNIFPENISQSELIIKVCNLISPLIGDDINLNAKIQTKENDIIAISDIEIKSLKPLKYEKFSTNFKNFYFEENFDLKINFTLPELGANLKGFFLIDFPIEYSISLSNMQINYSNSEKEIFIGLNYEKIDESIIKVQVQTLESKKIILQITNFKIPASFGEKIFQLYFIAESYEKKLPLGRKYPILEGQQIHFNPRAKFDRTFDISTTNQNVNSYTSLKMKFQILKNSSKQATIKINLGKILKIKNKDQVKIISQNKISQIIYNETSNDIIIEQLQLHDNVDTYIEFEIDQVFIQPYDTQPQTIQINIDKIDEPQVLYSTFLPNPINLQLNDFKIDFQSQNYTLKMIINSPIKIDFSHLLRINLPQEFQIVQKNCVTFNENIFECQQGPKSQLDIENERQNILILNPFKNLDSQKNYDFNIKGKIEDKINQHNEFTVDIIPYEDMNQVDYFIQTNKRLSQSLKQIHDFNCPKYCEICLYGNQSELTCFQCQDKYFFYEKNNQCLTSFPQEQKIEQNKIKLNEKIEKVFIAIVITMFFTSMILTFLFKVLFENFLASYFLASFYTFLHNILNYILLICTWNSYQSLTQLSLMNIFIGLFFLLNITITFAIFIGKKNKILNCVKIMNIPANSKFFDVFYSFFGTGCVLWTCSITQTQIYYHNHIKSLDIQENEKQMQKIIFYNLLIILGITLAAGIIFYLEGDSSRLMKILYIINGGFTTLIYVYIIIKYQKIENQVHLKSDQNQGQRYDFASNKFSSISVDTHQNLLTNEDLSSFIDKLSKFKDSLDKKNI